MATDDLYSLLKVHKDLITDFFILFSRFEYSLKRTETYAKGDQNEVKADWDKFAQVQDPLFMPDNTPELKAAVDYLEWNPPKKQVLKLGKLGWTDVPKQNNERLKCLLLAIRRVRNNLFHGGKFPIPYGPIEEPGRNMHLLQSCSTVLWHCLSLNEEVDRHFRSV